VYWEQFRVLFPLPEKLPDSPMKFPALGVEENEERLAVEGKDFLVLFSKSEGRILAYHANGRDLLHSGPVEQYYRAPTDIDLLMLRPAASIWKWRAAGIDRLERRVVGFEWGKLSPQEVIVRVHSRLQGANKTDGIDSLVTYRVISDGHVVVENEVVISDRLPFVPRVGLELVLPAGFERLVWYGRGPHENYCDRKLGAGVGMYSGTVDEQFTPYVYTSESGGKEDARWLALLDEEGCGLMAIGRNPLHFDALHYTVKDLEQAGHPYELTRLPETVLHLDGWHMGVGGDDGWDAPVHSEFRIPPGRYAFAFRLRPVKAGENLAELGRMGN
jgi:beta-galactosidase